MRAAIVIAFFAFVFTLVSAGGFNADRIARGLPPLPPIRRRPTPVALYARHEPSGVSQCNTGPIQCCNQVEKSDHTAVKLLLGLLGIAQPSVATVVGLHCSPLSVGGSCSQQAVCCQNNGFNGVIALGCTPFSLNRSGRQLTARDYPPLS